MIRMLTGVVADVLVGQVVLDVGGVGYLVSVCPDDARALKLDETYSLFTYLAVREDALDLYGFKTRDDLEMFRHLIDLPKIGPKSALAILSQANIELLKKAVATNDPAYLSKMSGMGKKTAEKIVLGLKDVLEDLSIANHDSTGAGDIIDALVTLGYSEREARGAVAKLDPTIIGTNARVKAALQVLSG